MNQRLPPRPGVRLQNLLQRRVRNDFVRVHRAPDGFGDLREIDFAIHERFDRDFVGGVQYRRQRAADLPCPARQFNRRKPFHVRLFKGQAAEFGEIRSARVRSRARSGYVSAY